MPNRQSRDNIIITQEVIHSMRRKKGKKGWMAINIGLQQAYDRLNWNFIIDTLKEIGLPTSFIDVVYHCISSFLSACFRKGRLSRQVEVSGKGFLYLLIFLYYVWRG